MPDITVITCDETGAQVGTETVTVPESPADVVAAAVATARAEVAGLSPTGATRQAVEALATAVEALTA